MRWTFIILLAALTAQVRGQAPVARADRAVLNTGQEGIVSVLDNDDLAGADSVLIELISQPTHGTIEVEAGGRLRYVPEVGFAGLDSLRYRILTVPVARLRVDSLRSELTLQAALSLPNIGTDTDEVAIRIGGTIKAVVQPESPPFDSVAVVDLTLSNVDPAALEFNYGSPITILTVDLSAQADGIQLSMIERGTTAAAGFAGLFTQTGNELGVAGQVEVAGSGVLGGAVPSGTEQFQTSTTNDLNGLAAASAQGIQVILTIDLAETVEIGGNTVALTITGEVVSTGPSGERHQSNEATVVLEVVSGVANETPHELPGMSVYPNPSSGRARVELPGPGLWTVEVVDLLGRVAVVAASRTAQVNLSGLAPGVYFVRARSRDGNVASRSLVVRR